MLNNTKNALFLDRQISKLIVNNFEAFLFAICIFLLTPPFFLWNSISPLVFVCICSLLSLKDIKSIDQNKFLFFVAFIFVYAFIGLKNGSTFFGFLSIMGICTLVITSKDFLNSVFKIYISIYSITIIPSIIVFLMVNLFGIDLPHSVIEPLNQLKSYDYVKLPFLVQENSFIEMILPRFCGYYDEPGVIGTISGVLLMSSGFNLKKKINIPIFLAGLLSFSFAFYFITLVYGFIFFSPKYKILLAIVAVGTVILFSKNELINSYILSRFEYSEGKFSGDNRIADESFKTWFSQYTESNDYYFGIGEGANQHYNSGGASFKDLIVNNGIIAFVFYIALLVSLALTQIRFNKVFFLYIFIIFSILYQRPFITSYFYMFLIFAPISFLSKSHSND